MSEFFDIDLNRLEWEWARQPGLYHDAAMKAADKRRDQSRAEAELELTEAEVDREVRQNPAVFGLEKLTEPAIKLAIVASKRYKRAQQDAIEAKHDLDVAEVAVKTLDHKKYALQDEVRLRLSNYFSEPMVKSDEGGDRMEKRLHDAAFKNKRNKT